MRKRKKSKRNHPISVERKTCCRCLIEKSSNEFGRDKSILGGLRTCCKNCVKLAGDKLNYQVSVKCKKCSMCGVEKSSNEFIKNKKSRDGLASYCCQCDALKSKKSKYKIKYDITLDDYNQMLKEQKGRCAICGTNVPGNKRL